MKAKLDRSYFWNRRSWGPGEVEIPNGLAIALGLVPTPSDSEDSGTPESSESAAGETLIPRALTIINEASGMDAIAAIPTIGKGAAKRILQRRPEGGYESLEQVQQLCPEIERSPYTTDWQQVTEWQ